jgi:O-acetyl-ADP-ribose deacetylase (regulator of RNase III)
MSFSKSKMKFFDYENKNTEITIQKGDITKISSDAIVNAANNYFYMGGRVAAAIKDKGGIEIEQDAVDQGPIDIGGAVTTPGYKLKAKFIIHAAVMGMPASPPASLPASTNLGERGESQGGSFQTDAERIRKVTKSAISEAEKNNCQSLAFSALGCGVGKFSYKESTKVMFSAIKDHFANHKSSLRNIVFVLYEQEAYDKFKKVIEN